MVLSRVLRRPNFLSLAILIMAGLAGYLVWLNFHLNKALSFKQIKVLKSEAKSRSLCTVLILIRSDSKDQLVSSLAQWQKYPPCGLGKVMEPKTPTCLTIHVPTIGLAAEIAKYLKQAKQMWPMFKCFESVTVSWHPQLVEYLKEHFCKHALVMPTSCIPVIPGWLEMLRMRAIDQDQGIESFLLKGCFRENQRFDQDLLNDNSLTANQRLVKIYAQVSPCFIINKNLFFSPKSNGKTSIEEIISAHIEALFKLDQYEYAQDHVHLFKLTGLITDGCLTPHQAIVMNREAILLNQDCVSEQK